MWVGEVLMGARFTAMNVVFDTGSDWLLVQGKSCASCKGNKYDSAPENLIEMNKSKRSYDTANF